MLQFCLHDFLLTITFALESSVGVVTLDLVNDIARTVFKLSVGNISTRQYKTVMLQHQINSLVVKGKHEKSHKKIQTLLIEIANDTTELVDFVNKNISASYI